MNDVAKQLERAYGRLQTEEERAVLRRMARKIGRSSAATPLLQAAESRIRFRSLLLVMVLTGLLAAACVGAWAMGGSGRSSSPSPQPETEQHHLNAQVVPLTVEEAEAFADTVRSTYRGEVSGSPEFERVRQRCLALTPNHLPVAAADGGRLLRDMCRMMGVSSDGARETQWLLRHFAHPDPRTVRGVAIALQKTDPNWQSDPHLAAQIRAALQMDPASGGKQ